MTDKTTTITLPLQLKVRETEHTYPVKSDLWANWYMFGMRAFERLRELIELEGKTARSFAATGTSNGIDAVIASLIFTYLEEIILIDLDQRVVQIAEENVRKNVRKMQVLALTGSLVEPLLSRRIKVDLVYANLPILPNGGDLTTGYRRASRYEKDLFKGIKTEEWITRYLLEPYYALLVQARKVLNQDGSVVCSIGGRIPYEVVEQMIERAGYKAQELVTGFKVQTEPWEVFPGFADAEKEGIAFDFYRYDEAVAALRREGHDEPFLTLSKEELREKLEPYKITAAQAYELYKQDSSVRIGHIVYMIRARKSSYRTRKVCIKLQA